MKKLIPLVIVGILLVSGLGAFATANNARQPLEKTQTVTFSQPVIQDQGQYSLVTMQNANSWLHTVGAPMLPCTTTTYVLPFGTTVTDVSVSFSEPQVYNLEKRIQVTPEPVTDDSVLAAPETPSIGPLYPAARFDYNLGAGIQEETHVLYLTVRCFPVQYRSADNSILYSSNAQISVSYALPVSQPSPTTDDYKLVIIAPEKFSDALQPLVTHKISKGVTTKLVTTDDVCQGTYFTAQGRDCAEQMKYFIKDAFDQWGTRYVLLVGGRYGGVINEKWWVPVRYSHLDDDSDFEGSYLSDLYFADIYDASGNFSSWDSNGDGIFAEWNSHGKDIIDMYPELYVGRLACKSVTEVKTVVSKIVTYENTTAGSAWFHNMVVVGGDSAPMENDPWFEGEQENALALQYMSGFQGTKLWTSTGSLTGPSDVVNAVSAGCGFLFFDGHGNPTVWSTHPPNNESVWITGLQVSNMRQLENSEMLPVCVCGGCHDNQFNTSLMRILKGVLQEGLKYFSYTFYYGDWVPECWGWKMVSVKNGGSIATMAYTGLDWFAEGDYNNDSIPDCVQFYSGFMNTQFFKNYGVNNITVLGQTYAQSLTDYLNAFPPMGEKLDCKTVQEFALLGDPSLQIGGYQ